MKTFRCPKCKEEIKETIYSKIKYASCRNCKTKMIKLYIPTKKILLQELEINRKLYIVY